MRKKAIAIFKEHFKQAPKVIYRFETGLAHHVYYTETHNAERYVLRLTHPELKDLLAGSPYWLNKLTPLGIKIPKLIKCDLEHDPPYLILDYCEGIDLGHVYQELSTREKKALAKEIADIQNKVETLPPNKGYGYLSSYEAENYKATWVEVIQEHLDRSRSWIKETGLFNTPLIDQLEKLLPYFENYFSQVRPIPFLDDTTTKNVLIHKGQLSAIVDLDEVCFGDKLRTLALTQMALLKKGWDTEYTDFWKDHLNLSKREEMALQFYTLTFCVDFMGGLGMTFNKENPPKVSRQEVKHLQKIYDDLQKDLIVSLKFHGESEISL